MFYAIALAAVLAIPAVDLSTKDQELGVECPALDSKISEEVTSAEPDGQCEGEGSEEVYENHGTCVQNHRKCIQNHGTRIQKSFGKLPLYFIENQGQLDEEVVFYVKGKDKTLYFTDTGVTFSLHGEDKRWNVKMEFADANQAIKPQGQDRQEALFSFFRGKKEDWKTAIPTYSKIVYENLWPGIDLVYYGTVNQLKYDFIVEPGADPDRIRFLLSGASDVVFQESGVLKVITPLGNIEDEKPTAFQELDGECKDVPVGYRLERSDSNDSFTLAFQVGDYDRAQTLVIDPVVLVYCGYIGGESPDSGDSVAIDTQGNSYITGVTYSPEYAGFPVLIGPDLTHNGFSDIYVAKVTADGTSLVYCGYIGGIENEYLPDIAVDKRGNAYVTGYTRSPGNSFPVVVGPDLTFNGYRDAFVAKIDSSGTSLVYCGFIGGSDSDVGYGIAVDDQENAFVVGGTYGAGFPVLIGPDLTYNGNGDAFVAKVSATGEKLLYCGYIGGAGIEEELIGPSSHDIAVDRQGNALVTGYTHSSEAMGFPVDVGPDLTFNGGCDAYVAKVSATGENLLYCGYIGGKKNDLGRGIATDEHGNAYVTGQTESNQYSFPVLVGPGLIHKGNRDAFVAKVSASGENLLYCGYIGGTEYDRGCGIAVDRLGAAYVTGETESSQSSFPVLVGPDLTYNGYFDAFVAKVEPSGASLVYNGYIGGIEWDTGYGIAVDELGNAYVSGHAMSYEDSFPVLVGPDLTFNVGHLGDAFIAKVLTTGLFCDTYDLSASAGGTVTFNLTAGSDNAERSYFLLGSARGISPGTPLPNGLTLPLNWDSFTAAVIGFANTPTFQNFKGELDINGDATATLNAPPIDPVFVGEVLHFAYVLYSPFDFVSNPVPVTIVP